MEEKDFITYLITAKSKTGDICHTPKNDFAYRHAADMLHDVITKTVSHLQASYEDNENIEIQQLRSAEYTLKRYLYKASDKHKKETIENFKTILIEKLNRMISLRKEKPNQSKDESEEN